MVEEFITTPIIFLILGILFSVFTVIRPFKIGKIPFDLATGPLFFLLLLLFFQVLDLETVKLGIIGDGQLRPWEIIVIFFTVAYVCLSTDATGIFDFLAYKIVHKSGGGIKLFLFFFLFTCALTTFTSNDIVILTLTPIIFYLSKHANINVIPFLFAEFFAANTLSMFLYIGNPTNIIVANATGWGFLEYTKIMWLPAIIAGLANFLLLYFLFRKQITKRFTLKETSGFAITNWLDVIISSLLLLAMLVTLFSSHYLKLPIWIITFFFSLIFIIEDLLFILFYLIKERKKKAHMVFKEKNKLYIAFIRMPWKILPFIFAFFIFVQGLNQYGIIDYLATIISQFSSSLFRGIAFSGVFGLIFANLINNQPMTIFLSNILVSKSFVVPDLIFQGSAYALVIASNLAANITLLGALAGIMWNKILETKGIEISYLDFLKKGLLITPIVFILTLASLYFVLR